MSDTNKLGRKIATLREAHHLSQQDLADRCSCDVETIIGLEDGELPASLAPLIKITRALGVRLGTLMDDDEQLGPAYIDSKQMEEVARLKSLQTGERRWRPELFLLGGLGVLPAIWTPSLSRSTPRARPTMCSLPMRARSGSTAWRAASKLSTAKTSTSCIPARASTTIPIVPHQVRAYDNQKAKFLAVVYTPV